jgi:acylphosphatase
MADPNDMAQAPQQRIHAIVHGLVQGVHFRGYTIQEANRLGLVGWVRNNLNGTVETVAEGNREQLEAYIDFLHVGSPSARVKRVDVTWQEASGDLDAFDVHFSW